MRSSTPLRVVAALVWIAYAVAAGSEQASADCSGPTLSYEVGNVASGASVRVEGTAFGTNCHDQGPPPVGEGILGVPVPAIEIVLVQGADEWVVAHGNSDGDYSFIVDITIPGGVAVGPATISARWAGQQPWQPYLETTEPLMITSVDPAIESEIAVFGPLEPAVANDAQTEPPTTTMPTTRTDPGTEPVPTNPSEVASSSSSSSPDADIGTDFDPLAIGAGVLVLVVVLLAGYRWGRRG